MVLDTPLQHILRKTLFRDPLVAGNLDPGANLVMDILIPFKPGIQLQLNLLFPQHQLIRLEVISGCL